MHVCHLVDAIQRIEKNLEVVKCVLLEVLWIVMTNPKHIDRLNLLLFLIITFLKDSLLSSWLQHIN